MIDQIFDVDMKFPETVFNSISQFHDGTSSFCSRMPDDLSVNTAKLDDFYATPMPNRGQIGKRLLRKDLRQTGHGGRRRELIR